MGTGYSNTDSLIFGGSGPGLVTEYWDGSSWSEKNDLSTKHGGSGSSASASANITEAFCAAGDGPPSTQVATTEEWSSAITATSFTSS
jgi:hypothetical protein